jgi:tryptophan synthase beta chain
VKGAIDVALQCKRDGKKKTILFNLCGHGNFDMQSYADFTAGKLRDEDYNHQELAMALAGLPKMPVTA